MKAILAVDLEEALTVGLAAALHRRGLGARVHSVPAPRAADAAQRENFDLVVVDLAEQPAPPPGLLPALAESLPGACLVVLAGSAVTQAPHPPAMLEGVEVMERALPLEELSSRIVAAMQRGVKGHLENVGLAAFIQLLAVEKETCTLQVRSAGRTGTICFVRGDLWDARAGGKHGDEAAIEIFGWETVDIDMNGGARQARRTISASLTYLLIEAMRRRDELVRDAPAGRATLRDSPASAASERRQHREGAASGGNPARALLDGLIHEVEGFVAACVVELASGRMVEAQSMRPGVDLELAGAASRASLLQVQALIGALRLSSAPEDLLFTASGEIHLIKPSATGFCVYLVADRAHTGYPQLRAALHQLWPAFDAGARAPGPGRRPHDPSVTLSSAARDR